MDYPKLPPVAGATTSVDALDLIQGINQVVRAAANDDARPLLTGVLFTTDNDTLRLIATDSYRLAVRDVPGVRASAGPTTCWCPHGRCQSSSVPRRPWRPTPRSA